MIARTRVRLGTIAAPASAPELPSNVVSLRPGFVLLNVSPTPANLQVSPTSKRGKKPSIDRGLHKPVSAFQEIEFAGVSAPANPTNLSREEFRKLISGMSKMQLREAFNLEANSHRDITSRCHTGRFKLHAEFKSFSRFLWHMGPRPAPDWTADRIDPANPEYGPALVRWAPPRVQANNRLCTVKVTDAAGVTRPLTEHARRLGVKPKTIAKRLDRGKSDLEALQGPKAAPAAKAAVQPVASVPVDYLDKWPEGATVDRWETPYQDFRAMHGRRLGPGLRRSVFFAWVTGNALASLAARLEMKFPGFREGEHDECQAYRNDRDRAGFDTLGPLVQLASFATERDRDARDMLTGLRRTFPAVRDQGSALRIRFPELDGD